MLKSILFINNLLQKNELKASDTAAVKKPRGRPKLLNNTEIKVPQLFFTYEKKKFKLHFHDKNSTIKRRGRPPLATAANTSGKLSKTIKSPKNVTGAVRGRPKKKNDVESNINNK